MSIITPISVLPETSISTSKPFDHVAVQIMVFVAVLILVIIICIILFKVCSHSYRRRVNTYYGRDPSVNSIEQLARQQLQDRPPSYFESTLPDSNPPPYHEVAAIKHSDAENESTANLPPYSECDLLYHDHGIQNPMIFYLSNYKNAKTENSVSSREMHPELLTPSDSSLHM